MATSVPQPDIPPSSLFSDTTELGYSNTDLQLELNEVEDHGDSVEIIAPEDAQLLGDTEEFEFIDEGNDQRLLG